MNQQANIPIIYIHKGYCPYLRLSLLQARKTNPAARLILLGDPENERLKTELNIEFYPFQNYFGLAVEFEKIYRHHSSNGYSYEVFCFQRWYVLQAFVAAEKLKGCFLYNDSDTFLFCDANALIARFAAKYDMSLCGPIAPCFVFFKNSGALAEFCNFISHQYTNEDNYRFLLQNYHNRQKGHIGELHVMFETISDMTMLGLFYRQHKQRMIDLCDEKAVKLGVFEENHYLGFHDRFQPRFPQGRKIRWKKGQPHYVSFSNKWTPVLGFHFQGHAKREMFRIFRGDRTGVPFQETLMHRRKYYRFILATCKKRMLKLIPGRT